MNTLPRIKVVRFQVLLSKAESKRLQELSQRCGLNKAEILRRLLQQAKAEKLVGKGGSDAH